MTDHPSPLPAVPAISPVSLAPASPWQLDDARERAIRLLTDGYAYDAISVEEFEWRLGQLSHAGSPQAMDALVADLLPTAAPRGATGPVLTAGPVDGRIQSIMSETRRGGPWRVPQRLRVKAIMSDVKLDLRHAILPPGCTIDVSAIMASVALIVPPGLMVEFDVNAIMGAARNDERAEAHGGSEHPHVRIRGSAVMAEVRVKVRERGR
jgi:hypothetical protein